MLYNRIKQYIDYNFAQQIDLKSVAQQFYISHCVLSRNFKKYHSVNFTKYLIGKRIDEAKRLLIDTNYKITKIAEISGIGSKESLYQHFTKDIGISPKEFRRINHK